MKPIRESHHLPMDTQTKSSPEFPLRILSPCGRKLGGELFAERGGKGGVAGGVQLGEESFDAGDGVGGDGLVRVEQRGDEVGHDGFHWLALLEESFKIGRGGFPKSTLQRGRRRVSKLGNV